MCRVEAVKKLFTLNEEDLKRIAGEEVLEELMKHYETELSAFAERLKIYGIDPYDTLRVYVVNYCGLNWERAKRDIAEMLACYNYFSAEFFKELPSTCTEDEFIEYVYGARLPPYRDAFEKCKKQLAKAINKIAAANSVHPLRPLILTYRMQSFWEEQVLEPLAPLAEQLPLVKTAVFKATVYAAVLLDLASSILRSEVDFKSNGAVMYL